MQMLYIKIGDSTRRWNWMSDRLQQPSFVLVDPNISSNCLS